MKRLLTWLSRKRFPYTPLIKVEISKSRLLNNLNEFRKLAPGGAIAPVLKSNAYGHGLLEIATILTKEINIPFFVVDSYFEAIALRSAKIKKSLLVIGYTQPETILKSKISNLSSTIINLETLGDLTKTKRPLKIHLKIDTGMHRQGIMPEEIGKAINILKKYPLLILEGICTHLSDSDNPDSSYSHKQILLWNEIASRFRTEFDSLKYFHVSNTYGHRFTNEIDANVSRLGIGLYGLAGDIPSQSKLKLSPVMEMKTIIASVKNLKKGDHVGYNNAFTAENDMRVATIPVGYYESIDRRLSNIGYILVGSNRIACPIIGKVSMNITSIDVSNVPNVKINDEVIVISRVVSDPNSIASIVKKSHGSIPYEMAARIPAHLKRVVV